MVFPCTIKDKNGKELAIFDGSPCEYRFSFYGRGQNTSASAPTIVKNSTKLRKGDLFIISLSDKDSEKLVMQVDEERPGQSGITEIQIDESIKKTFSLTTLMRRNHTIQKVATKESFALYLVEIQVKEQYLSRGDMWRFTRKLINTTVYLKKNLDIFSMRATVYGLWVDSTPFRVSSGYITKDTKIVFRSLSACCTIFLQMSKEMWNFDHYGDTYYEKAVDGFLFDLFTRWKNMSCQHDVTMTLFSRVFYDAKTIDDFPKSLHQYINIDRNNRFYEDFYRVIYQNERYDDWLPRLAKIKQVIINYKEDLVTYHKRQLPISDAEKMPTGTISSATDGNFLETLNLSSTVFERHYIDRPFDRLGQMSVIITPGAGVFEVDRALANMTKQRVLDNGIGSDLVCLGEQPLFAVPLFKFVREDPDTADNYQIPYWMNLSYYHSPTVRSCFKRYIPRLPFDNNRIKGGLLDVKNVMNTISEENFIKPSFLKMEEYDQQIFGIQSKPVIKENPREKSMKNGIRIPRTRHVTMDTTTLRQTVGFITNSLVEEDDTICETNEVPSLTQASNDEVPQFSNHVKDDSFLSTSHATPASSLGTNPFSTTLNQTNQVLFYNPQSVSRVAQSANTYFLSSSIFARLKARPKALTNPFAPASIRIPMVASRRRWAHTFPIGPNHLPWHFHHLRQTENAMKNKVSINLSNYAHLLLPGTVKRIQNGIINKRTRYLSKISTDGSIRNKRILSPSNNETKREMSDRKGSFIEDNRLNFNGVLNRKTMNENSIKIPNSKKKKEAIIWGPTGVEPWSASMITGIDWKSLTIPASLPTTFDVFPSASELERDYVVYSYTLMRFLPARDEYETKKRTIGSTTGNQEKVSQVDSLERQRVIFEELIDHRLSQGFQLIVEIPAHIYQKMKESIRRANCLPTEHNRLLSIGRIYHTVSLVTIDNQLPPDAIVTYVQQYKPQHSTQTKPLSYKYRFQCPDSSDYDPAEYDLQLDSVDSVLWNLIDNVVINHGTGDHKLSDTKKYWHTRLVIMPVSRDYTIRNIESDQARCDSRQEMTHEDYFLYVEHFVRFLFMLNKLTRHPLPTNECIHRPLDPVTGKKRADPSKRYGKVLSNFKKFQYSKILAEDKEEIKNLIDLLRDEHQGLLFVKDTILPETTFIAIEAIWWAIEHGEDIEDENMGLDLFQKLFTLGLIQHCTNIEKTFRFGFFLYYIVTEKHANFSLESNDYAEVEFHQTQSYIPSMDYLGFAECKPMRLLPKLIPTPHNANPISSPVNPRSTSSGLKRDCNVDVDPKHVSDRHEWATAHYHSYYNPHCLFELEIRWLVATSCILGDLISQWSQRTGTILGSNQVTFHLIPIPCDPFAEFDALRGPIYIQMDISCLSQKLASLSETAKLLRLSIFQELILKRYGFILNACVSYSSEKIYYVHISGGMLVYITSEVYNVRYNRRSAKVLSMDNETNGRSSPADCGFYWCWNFCLGKRWRSLQTGEEKYQDTMFADFRAFCTNDKNRLVQFWDQVNQMAANFMVENKEESTVNGHHQNGIATTSV